MACHAKGSNAQLALGMPRAKDLFKIVKAIDSKMLFPIHTEHPDGGPAQPRSWRKVFDKYDAKPLMFVWTDFLS